MRTYLYIPTLMLACVLGACGSMPSREPPPQYRLFNPATQPYWSNPYWQLALSQAVQSVVHLPANASSPAKPGIHATVQFTYEHGTIRDPLIASSTGSPDLDKLLLLQVMTAKIPKAYGLHTDQPHVFRMPLQMFTVYESFQFNLYLAIQSNPEYPRYALLSDQTGIATLEFDYLDSKASNIKIIKSSGHGILDQSSEKIIADTELPTPPPGYTGKTLHLQAIFCYSINYSPKCPTGNNVIDELGTRIRR